MTAIDHTVKKLYEFRPIWARPNHASLRASRPPTCLRGVADTGLFRTGTARYSHAQAAGKSATDHQRQEATHGQPLSGGSDTTAASPCPGMGKERGNSHFRIALPNLLPRGARACGEVNHSPFIRNGSKITSSVPSPLWGEGWVRGMGNTVVISESFLRELRNAFLIRQERCRARFQPPGS